jgi:serine/threonine protein kinase
MLTEFHEHVQRILEQAVQMTADLRAQFVRRACADQPDLLREVQSLLPHYEKMQDFEPLRPHGSAWNLPGAVTCAEVQAQAAVAAAEPKLPFCIDQYRAVEVLGRGGMGVVYRAMHATLHRPFALKVLRRELLSPELCWRFAFEAHLLRQLRHPGIARVLHTNEVSTTAGHQPYYVMEFIQGEPITRYADRRSLGTRARLALFAKVCDAMAYAHERGIVHRDLKPDNILVEESGQPKVLDFGIAGLDEFGTTMVHDRDGRFMGTFTYASPEQRAGVVEHLTPRSDVFSLGLIAHELFAGQVPARVNERVQLALDAVRLDDYLIARGFDEEAFRYYLKSTIAAAVTKPPEDRYASAGEFGAALESLLADYTVPSRWARLKSHVRSLFWPRSDWSSSPISRPLKAVLRTRLALEMQLNGERGPTPDGSPAAPGASSAPVAPRSEERERP